MLRGLAALLVVMACLVLRTGRVQAVGSPLLQGQSGAAVVQLQVQLHRAGFAPGPLDGKFGPLTAAAVRAAQEAAGLPATGTVDDPTRAQIAALSAHYRVRAGDTLADIASRLHLDLTAIIQANDLQSPDVLVTDQVLHLPADIAAGSEPGAINADDADLVVYLPTEAQAPPQPNAVASPALAAAQPISPPAPEAPPSPDADGEGEVPPEHLVLAPVHRRPESQAAFGTPPASLTPGPVISVPQPQRRAALTFNVAAQADAAAMQPLLSTLSDHGARATFFMPPVLLETQPELTARLLAGGHQVAYLADAVPKPLPADGVSLIRPAAGDWGPELVSAARHSGLRVALWSSIGLRDRPGIDAEALTAQALSALFPGAVLMLHAPQPDTTAALPHVLRALTFTAGYQLVPMEDLLDLRTVAAPVER